MITIIYKPSSYFLFAFSLVTFLFSCDKIKDPYVPGGGSTSSSKVRKVLVEEFTGHRDGHGAIAALQIVSQQNKYPGKMIVVAIHSGFFSQLAPPVYTADFHSNEGDDFHDFFNVTSNPVMTVNRSGYPNTILIPYNEPWTDRLDSLLLLPAEADLKITNHYNASTRMLNVSVRCEFLKPLNGTYKLAVLLTEDSIIASQRDYLQTPIDVLNYAHRYMLRDGITSDWGDPLVTGPVLAGDSIVKTFNYTLPANFNGIVPDENHCYVVAYIYDVATYKIIQAEEKKLREP